MLLDISRALRVPGEEIPFEHRDRIPPQEIFGETVTFDDPVLTGFILAGPQPSENNMRKVGHDPAVQAADMIFAVGGGKVMDIAKVVASRLNKPFFAFPTVAGSCAAASSIATLYTDDGHCAGCLRAVDQPLETAFDEVFVRQGRYPRQDENPEEEQMVYEGSKVELSHLVLTLVLLEMPMRLVCGGDCPALRDLQPDQEPSACQEEMPDQHPFSALQQLLNKDQEV